MDSEEFNYDSYKDSLNPEDREYFDQLVREEMMKLESGIVAQVDNDNENENDNEPPGYGGGRDAGFTLQSPQRRYVNKQVGFNDVNESHTNKKQQYAKELESDAINARRISYEKVAGNSSSTSNEGALPGLGSFQDSNSRPEMRRGKMDSYRNELDRQKAANDQVANAVMAPRNSLVNALNQRKEESYQSNAGFNIGSSEDSRKDSSKQKQIEYARQLQEQMQNQHLNGQGSGRKDYQARAESYGSLPANYIKVVSGRDVQRDAQKEAEAEEKRRKQQDYYDALNRDTRSKSDPNAPVPRVLIKNRGSQVEDNDNSASNTGFNIGADSQYAKELAREKQLIYAAQLKQARNAEPIPQSKVRLQSKKNSLDDNYDDGHTFNIGSENGGNFRSQRSGRSTDEMEEANRKYNKAAVYAQQLEDDRRAKLSKPEDNRGQFQYSNLEENSPGKKFSSGLDGRDGSEDYQKKTRQMEYAKALDADMRRKDQQNKQQAAASANDGYSFNIGSDKSQGGRGNRNSQAQINAMPSNSNSRLALAGDIALNSREREAGSGRDRDYDNRSNPQSNRNYNDGGNNSGRSNAAPLAYTKNPASRGNSHGGGVSSVFFG